MDASLYYSSKLLNILTAVAATGLVAFLFPKGELPAYITLIFSIALSFVFVMAQVSRRTQIQQSILSKLSSIFVHSYPTIVLMIILFFLALIFATYKHNIYDIDPPAEFTVFKWTSYILLVFQVGILFKYLRDELHDTPLGISGKTMMSMLRSNLKNILNVFSLINALIVGFIYIIISKFTTDG